MSEMDDELRRMTESYEDRIRRAWEAEEAELTQQREQEAAAEAAKAEAKAREERKQALVQKYRWPLRICAAVLGAGVASGIGYGVYALTESANHDIHNANLAYGLEPQLTSVEGLRAAGACADELQAEAELATDKSHLAPNSVFSDNEKVVAKRFSAAASLAVKYNVSCYPSNPHSENLTPDFDIPTLAHKHLCADELLAQQVDTQQANNSLYEHTLELKNDELKIAARLATAHHVSC